MQWTQCSTQLAAQTLASTTNQVIDLKGLDLVSLQVNYANATTSAKTFTSGIQEVDRITFASKASTTNGDYFVINDYLGGSWAVGLDTLGTGAATPTGAAWVAVPAANKVYTDISSATSGTDVELLVATAINALTGFTAVITTANSTTHLDCTNVFAGVVVTPAVYSRAGASGTGSVTFGITTTGTVSKINPATNAITITAHGQVLGSKIRMTTSSSLPGGITNNVTDYFVIVVDANTIKLASSLANAVAGTVNAFTSSGVGTQTITPTASTSNVIKAQFSNDNVYFTDITTTNFPACPSATVTVSTTAGGVVWDLQRPASRYVNILFTPSAGQITFSVIVNAKTDK